MNTEKPNRRDFLRLGAAGVAALTAIKNLEANQAAENAAPAVIAREPHPELSEMGVAELQEQMKRGALTSQTLVDRYLARIHFLDPKIHSVLEINPDALTIAAQMDRERVAGRLRGPLHGVPVLIKDNIDTRDKMHTTAGSLALLDAPTPARDAFIVAQLRRAGAVLLGKTNLSEWANFRSTRSSSGWSGRGGQTNNPYILSQNPCGSSSGTGAAISAGLAVVGVGTETNGSIICPSVRCGLVGLKPTLGLVSRSGIIPISHSQDTAGPMTRTVSDAAILLGVMAGRDESDATTSQHRGHRDYTRFLDKSGLKGTKIGVARQFVGRSAASKAAFEAHLQVLKDGGANLVDVTFTLSDTFGDDETEVLLFEFKAGVNAYLASRNAPHRTLADLIAFNEANKEREMPLFGQELFLQAQERGDLTSEKYRAALGRLQTASRAQGIDAVIKNEALDAIVSPTGGATWGLAAVAGYPYITVPAGFSGEMPTGIGFFGSAFSEPQLIQIAYAFEQKTRARRTPKYLPTA